MMISVVATVALAVLATLQVSATSETDCARTIHVDVPTYSDLNTLVGGMYVLDSEADVIQYKREDGAMCMALKSEKGEQATTAIGETCEKREVEDRVVAGDHVSVVTSSPRWDGVPGEFPLCQPYRSNVTIEFIEWTNEDGYDRDGQVSFTFTSAESPCSECREVTQGDLKGVYELESVYSSYCGEGTDKCVYSDNNNQTYCFEVENGLYDTMLTCN